DCEQLQEFRLHAAETVAGEIERSEVGLEIESGYFGGQSWLVGVLQDFERDRRRPEVTIDQKHLLFRSDAQLAALNVAVVQHERERTEVFEERLHELLRLALVNILFNVVLTHPVPSKAT